MTDVQNAIARLRELLAYSDATPPHWRHRYSITNHETRDILALIDGHTANARADGDIMAYQACEIDALTIDIAEAKTRLIEAHHKLIEQDAELRALRARVAALEGAVLRKYTDAEIEMFQRAIERDWEPDWVLGHDELLVSAIAYLKGHCDD